MCFYFAIVSFLMTWRAGVDAATVAMASKHKDVTCLAKEYVKPDSMMLGKSAVAMHTYIALQSAGNFEAADFVEDDEDTEEHQSTRARKPPSMNRQCPLRPAQRVKKDGFGKNSPAAALGSTLLLHVCLKGLFYVLLLVREKSEK